MVLLILAGCALPPPASVSADGTASPPSQTSSPNASTPTPSAPSPRAFVAAFDAFAKTVDARLGIAVVAVGDSGTPTVAGKLTSGVAWSTMKVPLGIAAGPSSASNDLVRRAIQESSNSAAESLWSELGGGTKAAAKIDAVLAAHGDRTTTTQPTPIRQGFSAYGQTQWTLTDQARFTATLPCAADAAQVYGFMGSVDANQRWGLGSIAGAHIKGGWGPDASGAYVVRQMGVFTLSGRAVAVTVMASSDSGTFTAGTKALTQVAAWLDTHRQLLPGGHC